MLVTSKSLRFVLRLLQSATQAATMALLVLGCLESGAARAQTVQVAARTSAATASLSTLGREDALIQKMAGRVVKQANSIGRTTVQSLAPTRRSASALTLDAAPVRTIADAKIADATVASSQSKTIAALPHTPPESALESPRPADSVKIPPTPIRAATPLPPAQSRIAMNAAPAAPVADRVFQSPNYAVAPASLNSAPVALTNPAYLAAVPYGAYPIAQPGYPMSPPAYGYGYPMAAPAYPMVAAALPPLPSPYAALQQQPYGAGMMPQLTPPVARLQASGASPLMVPSATVPQAGYPIAAAPQPQYYAAPPQYAQPYGQPQYYAPQPMAYAQPQYAPQPYYAAPPQQYVPPQYQPQYGMPQYAQQPMYAPQPQQYYAPQPQYYQQYAPQPQFQLAPQSLQPQPQLAAPQQYAPQPPTPQLGFYPQGGYQQPAIANPLNAPLSVPVNGAGVASGTAPSTNATALQGTQSSLIRSTATNQPSLTLQGVYLYQGDENSARGRITGVYPLSSRALFGTTLDVSTGKGFSDTPNSGFNVNELFFATSLAEIPNLRFVVGQMDLTSYFDRNSFAKDGATHFFNSTFQTNAALAAAGLGSRPGLLVNWSLSDNLEAKAAAFSSSRGLSDFALNAFAGELGLRYGNAILRGTYVTGRESGNGNVFDGAGSIKRGAGKFGILADDRESAFGVNGEVFMPKLKLGLFGRYGRYNNLDANEGADTYGAGLSFLDVFSKDDRLGLAYGSALTNERLRRSVSLPKRDVLELFYDFRFLPNLRVGLSLQQRNDFSEIVAGVRVKTEFDITPKGRLLQ